ncbi:twitching motility protein PilT [Massilia sp. WF1]|uniref:Mut7-C RNAse domain-containing protein n=1 Tax=unclassified Massilia TaxID=2609279 RepID=UPI00064A8EAB|nr:MULTISPECIES: Mut7-C RNAse domain-containing protein [unclassified Massilia]ALK97095.1 twitching motility protein PilT [Massilia sp. WG5]KLU36143.1 twitching motility protein PilT [Massilia sp. WF1]
MVCATFRFYGELNDFLPRERRGRELRTPCARMATTKHMIEALGVPHTEVELVLVNGEGAGLDLLLEEGDRVAVYPRFTRFDVSALAPAPTLPPGRLRFVADAHLGGLARLLRMAGFDTIYDNSLRDDQVEALAVEEDRIVLTRDRELLKRRSIDYGCYVRALKAQAQLREVFERLGLAGRARPFTRCLHDNAPLRDVPKAVVLDRLPPRVAATQEEFSTCALCGRVYWKGSHWQRMSQVLRDVHYDDPLPDSVRACCNR